MKDIPTLSSTIYGQKVDSPLDPEGITVFVSQASMLGAHRDCLSSSNVGLLLSVIILCFWTVSQKWLDGLNSDLACGCNWSSSCALF